MFPNRAGVQKPKCILQIQNTVPNLGILLRGTMKSFLIVVAIIAVWLALQLYILPKLGIST